MEKIGFIGAGKVGKALGAYFHKTGLEVVGFYSRSFESARTAAALVASTPYTSLSALVNDCSMLFITTPDKAIASTASAIVNTAMPLEGKWVLHCSGALESTILSPCLSSGASIASLHPLQAFNGNDDLLRLKTTYMTLESPGSMDNGRLNTLITSLGNPYKWIKPEQKVLYHGAAVVMSNYMVTLVEEGLKYLRHIGFDDQESMTMMMPLMQGTLTNIQSQGTAKGLTGPLKRGDTQVIEKHLAGIGTHLGSQSKDFYQHLGRQTLDMLKSESGSKASYETLSTLFKE